MKHISSRDNPLYKRLARLGDGKRDGHTMLEGIHVCQTWVDRYGMPELALFDGERLAQNAELGALAQALGSRVALSCDSRLMRNLSQVEHGQGVCFLVSVPEPLRPASVAESCLWLDRVQDPGNVGTLLRTAAAAGIHHVYLSEGSAAAWSAKVLRSAQGAHFSLSIYERVDLLAERDKLKVPLIATALAQARSIYTLALPRHCAWLFGHEGQGVQPALLAAADERVFIPQAPGVESLNVAAAAAVCLFEHRRQWLDQAADFRNAL
ncbi:TrmH family RNA methyltransferase [Paralcaligenes ureilyticus]|uniref:TrmH family RNA methyltransferase n=1 Tax=Paralcaligenes ureilyticus TaxID=627131 RepID=A0A4R3M941_9BURK|nr:RNA methyltransferase [Paralcaligenes ureilyticus]TCT10064.1 TrmH family RNA methyltransferase [Paralcaligenes ureilyticus]